MAAKGAVAQAEATVVTSLTTTVLEPRPSQLPSTVIIERFGFAALVPTWPPAATRYIWLVADGQVYPAGTVKWPFLSVVAAAICEDADAYPLVPAAYKKTEAPTTGCAPDRTVPFSAEPPTPVVIAMTPELAFVESAWANASTTTTPDVGGSEGAV